MIIDAQVHLSSQAREGDPLGPMSAELFMAEMDKVGVQRAVISPPTLPGQEEYAFEAAKKYPDRFAVMAWLNPDDPGTLDRIAAWKAEPGLLAFRIPLRPDDTARWIESGTLDAIFEAGSRSRVAISVVPWGIPLSLIAPVVERHPRLRLTIDHLNLVGSTPADVADRIKDLIGFAKYLNVTVKLAGVPSFTTDAFPYPNMQQHLADVISAYGPERILWGADYTMVYRARAASYEDNFHYVASIPGVTPAALTMSRGGPLEAWWGWPS